MRNIIDICDKIIELDNEIKSECYKSEYSKKCEFAMEEFYDCAGNHAAKLAMALKTSILELEKFSEYYADAVYYCPDESIECLKEIEEIFKWARREVEK